MIAFSVFAILTAIVSTQFILKADPQNPNVFSDNTPLHSGDYNNVGTLLDRGLEFLEYFIGTLGIIGFLISGIQFGMSGGDPEKAKKAKMNMVYTSIGIFLAVMAFALTKIGFSLFS